MEGGGGDSCGGEGDGVWAENVLSIYISCRMWPEEPWLQQYCLFLYDHIPVPDRQWAEMFVQKHKTIMGTTHFFPWGTGGPAVLRGTTYFD